MEENSSLFSLSIDNPSKAHLADAARWARFLAIIGFVFLGLMVVAGFFMAFALNKFTQVDSELTAVSGAGFGGILGATTAFTYILMAVIYFFPLLYLLRFANNLNTALATNEQEHLIASFQNLKSCLRYVGIVTIIVLVFMAIAMVVGMAGLAMA